MIRLSICGCFWNRVQRWFFLLSNVLVLCVCNTPRKCLEPFEPPIWTALSLIRTPFRTAIRTVSLNVARS